MIDTKNTKNKIKIKGAIGKLKVGSKKQFVTIIDSYLLPDQKPAYIRIWLDAQYTVDGKKYDNVFPKFLEPNPHQICTGLSGLMKEEISFKIQIPEIDHWIKYANKVTLNAAIVKKNINAPSQILDKHVIAKDSRKLTYYK